MKYIVTIFAVLFMQTAIACETQVCAAESKDDVVVIESSAHEDAIQILVKKLEERDLTLQEMREANLDLLVQNVGLKRANESLRIALKKKTAECNAWMNKYKDLAKSKMEDWKKSSIVETRNMLKAVDSKLEKLLK